MNALGAEDLQMNVVHRCVVDPGGLINPVRGAATVVKQGAPAELARFGPFRARGALVVRYQTYERIHAQLGHIVVFPSLFHVLQGLLEDVLWKMGRRGEAEQKVVPTEQSAMKTEFHGNAMVPATAVLKRHVAQGTPAFVSELHKGEIRELTRDRWHYVVQGAQNAKRLRGVQ